MRLDTQRWHTYRVEVRGQRVRVLVDGRTLLDRTLGSVGAGTVGLGLETYRGTSQWDFVRYDTAPGHACTIRGTDGPDVLVGTPRADVVCAGAGDDHVSGLGGDDVLVGGPGDDVLVGGPCRDLLQGGWGDDVLDGTDGVEGNDDLDGGPGIDVCTADAGDVLAECNDDPWTPGFPTDPPALPVDPGQGEARQDSRLRGTVPTSPAQTRPTARPVR